MSAGPSQNVPPADSSSRRWLHRLLAAVLVPAVFLVAAEGLLRLAGVGRPAGFLIPDTQPGYVRTNPEFASLYLPASFDRRPLNFRFPARKPDGTVRIVVLGESAAHGVPEPAFGFAPQLRALLRARHPGTEFEVLNTGIVAINSHVVRRIARDFAPYGVDVFVVYLGNNEVVGPYAPGCSYLSAMPPLPLIRLSAAVRSTRLGQLLSAALARLGARTGPAAEWGGMAMFVDTAVAGDDPRLAAVEANFEANLRDIVAAADGAGARTVLATVVANTRDCAPFLSLHRPGLSAADLAAWENSFRLGRLAASLQRTDDARRHLGEALRIDPQYADTSFLLGSVELAAGRTDEARRHLTAALHWDALRFRPDPAINAVVRRVAAGHASSVTLVDAAREFGADPASAAPPAGRDLLFEHVHFTWAGNHRLARLLAPAVESALGRPAANAAPWPDEASVAVAVGYTDHGRLPMLLAMEALVRKPPFSNQLTFGPDLARWARELDRAQAAFTDPAKLQAARATIAAAQQADPRNPDLAALARGLAIDAGDLAGALDQAHRERDLRPAGFATAAEESAILARLGRTDEALRLLSETSAALRDARMAAPAFTEVYRRAGRIAEGRRLLDDLLRRHSGDRKLLLLRARLVRAAGDATTTEREYRAILTAAPDHEDALEDLVQLLRDGNRDAEVGPLSLEYSSRQPSNHANTLRAALAAEAAGQEAAAARLLEAARRTGPVNAAIETKLARQLLAAGRREDAALHLALARELARIEDDPETFAATGQILSRLGFAPAGP